MIGLESGTVRLCDHEIEWEIEAKRTIEELYSILGEVADKIEHVGSTSIKSIKAKPIIDIAVAVKSFEAVGSYCSCTQVISIGKSARYNNSIVIS